MKVLLLLIGALPLSLIVNAQNVKFDYDNTGNRILRKPAEALPVTLISFDARKQNQAGTDAPEDMIAWLTWQTSAEVNADHFRIERSTDGKSWYEIGRLAAKGEFEQATAASQTDYSFADEVPAEGDNLYRLRMVDKDSSFAYSQLRQLHFDFDIFLYPNPVKTSLSLKSPTLNAIQLFDTAGKRLYQKQYPATSIDVSALPSGVYILRMTDKKGRVFDRKFVKQ